MLIKDFTIRKEDEEDGVEETRKKKIIPYNASN